MNARSRWFKDGRLLSDQEKYQTYSELRSGVLVLVIKNVTDRDLGHYECEVGQFHLKIKKENGHDELRISHCRQLSNRLGSTRCAADLVPPSAAASGEQAIVLEGKKRWSTSEELTFFAAFHLLNVFTLLSV